MPRPRTTRRGFLKALSLGAAALSAPGRAGAAAAGKRSVRLRLKAKKPNIVLVLTDDQGWTDTSVQMPAGRPDTRSDFYRAPALERLARVPRARAAGQLIAWIAVGVPVRHPGGELGWAATAAARRQWMRKVPPKHGEAE